MSLLFAISIHAQDHQFSQFYASPLSLNPALTGSINGQHRIIANYRNQWPQLLQDDAYQTYAVSYDLRKNFKSGDYLGLGFLGYGDVAGGTRFGTAQVSLSCSYAKIISKSNAATHSIIGGIQWGIAQRKIDPNNLRWPSSPWLEPSEPIGIISQPDFLYTDFNGGLIWQSSFGERKSFYAGISLFHINRPNVSFQNNSIQRMYVKSSINVGGELPFWDRLSLLPSALFISQGVHSQLNIGTLFRVSELFFDFVQGGIFYRAGQDLDGRLHSNAIVTMFSIQFNGSQLGFSYDLSLSELQAFSAGAFEVSLGHILGKGKKDLPLYGVPQI